MYSSRDYVDKFLCIIKKHPVRIDLPKYQFNLDYSSYILNNPLKTNRTYSNLLHIRRV